MLQKGRQHNVLSEHRQVFAARERAACIVFVGHSWLSRGAEMSNGDLIDQTGRSC